MQLGTRWPIGSEPPARLPEAMLTAIAAVEADLAPASHDARRWTLTWLERRPHVELDDGPSLSLDVAGAVVMDDPDD